MFFQIFIVSKWSENQLCSRQTLRGRECLVNQKWGGWGSRLLVELATRTLKVSRLIADLRCDCCWVRKSRDVASFRKVLGPSHPETLISSSHLGYLCCLRGNLTEVGSAFRTCLAGCCVFRLHWFAWILDKCDFCLLLLGDFHTMIFVTGF